MVLKSQANRELGTSSTLRQTKMIPQMEPWFGEEEASAVCEYMRSGGWMTEFSKTREFESMIAAYTGATHCIVTNNGTVSLTLAALACGLRAGDEVIVPNYTMIASPNSVCMFGANPMLVDVEAKLSASTSQNAKRR